MEKNKIPNSLLKYKLLKLTFKRNIENDRVKSENGLINSGSRKKHFLNRSKTNYFHQ